MRKKLTPEQIREGIIIGLKTKNKKKRFCIRGHLLPTVRTNGRRKCDTCVRIRHEQNPEKRSQYQHTTYVKQQKIKESNFPMVTRLEVSGVKLK